MKKRTFHICLLLIATIFIFGMVAVNEKAKEFERNYSEYLAYNQAYEVEPIIHTPNTESEIQSDIEPIWIDYTFTAYCGCEKCCGKWAKNRPNGIVKGAGGVELKSNYHFASPLPFGTIIEDENGNIYECQDRTAKWVAEKYDGKIIDVYFDNHKQAVEFGKKIMKVRIITDESN